MTIIDNLIQTLITTRRQATYNQVKAIQVHVAQAPFASYLSKVPKRVRRPLAKMGILTATKMPSVEWHLLERVHLDQQWPLGTSVAQYVADLQQAIQDVHVQIWTYRYYRQPVAAFLAPSYVQQVPKPEAYICVIYSPVFQSITTGYQASSSSTVFGTGCTNLFRHL